MKRRNKMTRLIDREIACDDILHFKKLPPYPLKDFFRRNGITAIQIIKALGLQSVKSGLARELNGIDPMPDWIDRKLKATALNLHKQKRLVWPLYKEEEEYCKSKTS